MYSKIGSRPWRIETRLTLWFGVAACALAGAVAGANYWLLETQRTQDADEWMAGTAQSLHKKPDKTTVGDLGWGDDDLMIRVIGPDGQVRFESPAMDRLLAPDTFPEPSAVGTDWSGDGKWYRLLSYRIDGWTYQLASDQTHDQDLFARYRQNLLFAIVPTVALGLVGGYVLARRGLRPLREVTAAVRVVSPSRLGDRIPVAALPAELLALADAFNGVMDRLQEAFTRLDQFSADIAHELRTPVHNLRGGVEVAMARDRTPAEYRRTLDGVLAEADRLNRLIDRLLLLARIEDPRRALSLEPTDISGELDAIREFFDPSAAAAQVAVRVDAPAGLSAWLDRALLQRAMSNLVGNALAHTPAGGTVTLSAAAGPAEITLAVADTGTGISAEDLPRLFDRYHRSARAKADGRGVGLGLAIVQRVVELHGGVVAVESEPGRGTTIRLTFPGRPEHDTDVIFVPRS
jgi:two-component system heavy metal sensor histidine kinase CusS